MLKMTLLCVLLCCVGCQTTTTPESGVAQAEIIRGNGKLLLRVEKIVGTYEVDVQRAVHMGADPAAKDQWKIVASTSVAGYPGGWLVSDGAGDASSAMVKGTYRIGGEEIAVSLDGGTRLMARITPETSNTARVSGVFVHVDAATGKRFATPFDVTCVLGNVVVLQRSDAAQL